MQITSEFAHRQIYNLQRFHLSPNLSLSSTLRLILCTLSNILHSRTLRPILCTLSNILHSRLQTKHTKSSMSGPTSYQLPSTRGRHEIECSNLLTMIRFALRSGKYSDLKLVCGSETFNVHRVIVCMQSKFFAAACDGKFMEAQTGTINLIEDDPRTVERMLSYIYTGDYDDYDDDARNIPFVSQEHRNMVDKARTLHGETLDGNLSDNRQNSGDVAHFSQVVNLHLQPSPQEKEMIQKKLINNISVYSIADKYDLPILKSHALLKFHFLIDCPAYWPFNDFAAVMQQVLETTPQTLGNNMFGEGLWGEVAQACILHAAEILGDEKCRGIMSQATGFGLNLMNRTMKRLELHDDQMRSSNLEKVKLRERIASLTNELDQKNRLLAAIDLAHGEL